MFQFRPFPSYTYLIQCTMLEYCSSGFPHSEIHGLADICSSPWLIAACHVLRRLLMPRHSPCARYSLTYRIIADSQLNYAGTLTGFFRNCNCYPSIRCSTIKTFSFFRTSVRKTSLLPCLSLSSFFVQFSRYKRSDLFCDQI